MLSTEFYALNVDSAEGNQDVELLIICEELECSFKCSFFRVLVLSIARSFAQQHQN